MNRGQWVILILLLWITLIVAGVWQRPLREATLGELFLVYVLAAAWWRVVARPFGSKED